MYVAKFLVRRFIFICFNVLLLKANHS